MTKGEGISPKDDLSAKRAQWMLRVGHLLIVNRRALSYREL